jgi:hypothetical protein
MTFLPFAGILVCAVFLVGMARKHWKWMGIVVGVETAIALLAITAWDNYLWEILFFTTGIWEDSALGWLLVAITVVNIVLMLKFESRHEAVEYITVEEHPFDLEGDEEIVLSVSFIPAFAHTIIALGVLVLLGCFFKLILLPIGAIIVAGGIILCDCHDQLTITTKGVYYQGLLQRRISLPLCRISAVRTALFGALRIATAGDQLILFFVPEHLEVHDTISDLLKQIKH